MNSLIIDHNLLTSLNVSSNPALHNLICSNNQLTTLNLNANQNLFSVICSYNQLESLLINNCANITSVVCEYNFLTSLDVTNMQSLNELYCAHNTITSVDLTGTGIPGYLFFLDCIYNNLTEINTNVMTTGVRLRINCSQNPNLTTIRAKNGAQFQNGGPHGPPFPNLFIGGTPSLQYICVDDFNINFVQNLLNSYGYTGCTVDSACTLGTTQFTSEDLIVFPNPVKRVLYLESKSAISLKAIEIYNVLGQLTIAVPNVETLSSIDVSSLKTGSYFIKIISDKGTASTKFIKE